MDKISFVLLCTSGWSSSMLPIGLVSVVGLGSGWRCLWFVSSWWWGSGVDCQPLIFSSSPKTFAMLPSTPPSAHTSPPPPLSWKSRECVRFFFSSVGMGTCRLFPCFASLARHTYGMLFQLDLQDCFHKVMFWGNVRLPLHLRWKGFFFTFFPWWCQSDFLSLHVVKSRLPCGSLGLEIRCPQWPGHWRYKLCKQFTIFIPSLRRCVFPWWDLGHCSLIPLWHRGRPCWHVNLL